MVRDDIVHVMLTVVYHGAVVFAIVYVWAKENADQEVNFIFNLARFKVPPVLFVILVPDSCRCSAFGHSP